MLTKHGDVVGRQVQARPAVRECLAEFVKQNESDLRAGHYSFADRPLDERKERFALENITENNNPNNFVTKVRKLVENSLLRTR